MTEIHIADIRCAFSDTRCAGFCVDIGAPKSVIGRKVLHRYLTDAGVHQQRVLPSTNRFRFADASYDSLGRVSIPLRTPSGLPKVLVDLDIVDADIPALLGMDVLDKESLTPCTVSNRLIKRVPHTNVNGQPIYIDEWHIPLLRSNSNHLYAEMDIATPLFFTRTQLARLHRQFFHPSASKLFNLLKRSRPEEATPETFRILQDLSKRCDPCQRIQHAPARFRVSLGAENVRFNERVFLDLMYIDREPILQIIDDGTKFGASRFLPDSSVYTIWQTILECWATIYTGLPNRIITDQGSQFGERFIHVARSANVEVLRTGVEAHSSLGIGERYHEPLRTTYRKLMKEHPNTNKHLALALAQKAMNDTLGPEGLVPSALVFGEFPQIYTLSEIRGSRSTLQERSDIANTARQEMETQMAKLKVKRALHYAIPPSSDRSYQPGDKVLVWREKIVANRIGEWLGPFEVTSFDAERKLIYVRDVKVGPAAPFNVAQVKPYYPPETLSHLYFVDLLRAFEQYKSPDDVDSVHMTEVIASNDGRAQSHEMNEAKKNEIRGLLERGTFKVILKEDIPADANVLPGRFVLAIKSSVDGKIKHKARYVIGGHRDKLKSLMVHSTSTLQPPSVRILLTLANMFQFDIWTADIRQAYLQTSEPLSRDIFIRTPPAEFELSPTQCLQLLKPLYGLCDAGDLWHTTLDKHHRYDLKMTPFKADPALYYSTLQGTLCGLSGCYVDDIIRSGKEEFRHLCQLTNQKFELKEEWDLPFEFTGFIVNRDHNGNFVIDQRPYLRKLETLTADASFSRFHSMRMRLAWLSNSRPDCLVEISQLAQVTEEIFNSQRSSVIKRLNKAIKYAAANHVGILIPKLNFRSIRVIGFSDSSFANNYDLTTQLGYIIFLVDDQNAAAPIYFKSYKARRIVRSAMAGEVIAFSDMFDVAAALAQELSGILSTRVPVQLFTDSKSLFDVISKGSRTSEKRTSLDIAAAREGFRDKVISDIGFIRSSKNIADGLTKPMNQATLRMVLCAGELSVSPEQWIVRGKKFGGEC